MDEFTSIHCQVARNIDADINRDGHDRVSAIPAHSIDLRGAIRRNILCVLCHASGTFMVT